jgi:type III pantothenate kinase
MDLLIDIGNTRIKWTALAGSRLASQSAAAYAGWDAAQLREQMLANLSNPTRVFVANVGGPSIATLVTATIEDAFGITPHFVHSSAVAAGVKSAYRNPEQLGVDRWLAMIGAYQLERVAACVVSVGTAMTVDGVDASGQHLGGIIVPGPDLMVDSLYRNTSDIASRALTGSEGTSLFADNTQAAVHQGVIHSLAATIERTCHDMYARFDKMPALLITGGASGRITGALRVPFRIVPDLVLRGLAEIVRRIDASI